jgi:hypothetical protein
LSSRRCCCHLLPFRHIWSHAASSEEWHGRDKAGGSSTTVVSVVHCIPPPPHCTVRVMSALAPAHPVMNTAHCDHPTVYTQQSYAIILPRPPLPHSLSTWWSPLSSLPPHSLLVSNVPNAVPHPVHLHLVHLTRHTLLSSHL